MFFIRKLRSLGVMSEELAAALEQVAEQPAATGGDEQPPKTDDEKAAEKDAGEGEGEAAGGEGKGEGEAAGKVEEAVKEKPKTEEEEKPQQSDPEEPDDGVPIVLVTGASGFLGSHVTHQLLQDGRFRVRGTVRSLDNEKKVKHLREMAPEAKYPLRLIEADLLKPKTWLEAVRRCRFVIHVASPITSKSKNLDVFLKPAVEGTTNVLKACVEAGTVKRVVVTSSTTTVCGLTGDPSKPADHKFTEADFTSEDQGTPYEKSKVRAEKAAWEFVKGLESDKQFELVTVCPGLLEGPLFAPIHKEGSVVLVANMVAGKMSRFPDVYFAVTDVRDTARAHILALEKAEAAGNRYLSFTEMMSLKEMAQIVAEELKPQGYKIGTKNMPKAAMWAAKFVNSQAKLMYTMLGKKINYCNDKMKGELGIEPRTPKETLIDTAYSVIEMGIVPKKPGYLGHPSTRPEPPPTAAASGDTAAGGDAGKEQPSSSEPAKTEEKPSEASATEEPVKAEEPPSSEQTKADEPPSEPAKAEAPPKAEEPPSEPIKAEEPPSEPPKTEEPPSEPPKAEEPPSEPPKVEEPPSEPPKVEEPPSEPPKAEEPPSEPAKVEEPPSEEPPKEESPPKDEQPPSEPAAVEPAASQDPEPAEPPSVPATQDEPPPASEPAQGEDPSTEPANEEPAATEPPTEGEQPQDTPAATEGQDEPAKDADTES